MLTFPRAALPLALSFACGSQAHAQQPPVDSSQYPRVRAGVSGGVALYYLHPYEWAGPGGQVDGRVGAQLNAYFALVYQGGLAFFYSPVTIGDYTDTVSFFAWQSSALALFTAVDVVDVALGPAVDAVFEDGGRVSGDPPIALGAHARTAVRVPMDTAWRGRFGLQFALDMRSLWFKKTDWLDFTLLQAAATCGVEWL